MYMGPTLPPPDPDPVFPPPGPAPDQPEPNEDVPGSEPSPWQMVTRRNLYGYS
jgi:hypothetical protein